MSRRPYIRTVDKGTWYLRQPRYRVYMLRELTCVLVAIYCVLILNGLAALGADGPERWQAFITGQQNPLWMAFHGLALVYFVVYQTIAWFRLAPKAMPLELGGTPVPARAIIVAHHLVWFVATVVVLWIMGVF